ncbi:MAG: patatin-like phospholipase family protein [Endomicrobium sp.]|nr:patatin-like phospholipase family protein [Endomicrobium sp.]
MCDFGFSDTSLFDYEEDRDGEDLLVEFLWPFVSSKPVEQRPRVALVLSGGGARGISQVGVGRVIQREKIPVDLVVGTSVGAVVGAFYCAGVCFERLDDLAKNLKLTDISDFSYLSFIRVFLVEKIFSNANLEKFVNKNIGEISFDQLQIPLICVTTDLNTGERVLLKEGSVAFAARASTAIPGVCRPVEYRQRYLVDGGISENIPVSVARIFGMDVIIAVAVDPNITKNNVGKVFQTFVQAMYIQGNIMNQNSLSMADIVIRPEVGSLSIFDFKNAYETVDNGSAAATCCVKDIKKIIINKMAEKYLLE